MPSPSSDLTIKCKNCTKEIPLKRPWQKFCSPNCRFAYRNNKSTTEWKVKNTDLTPNEKTVLRLVRDEGLTTVRAIGERTIIHRNNLYHILNSLVYKNFLERIPTNPASWKFLGGPVDTRD